MGEHHGLLRVLNRLQHGAIRHVGVIDQDAQLVHLANRGQADVTQTLVGTLPAAVSEEVSLIVGELDDSHTQRVKEAEASSYGYERFAICAPRIILFLWSYRQLLL